LPHALEPQFDGEIRVADDKMEGGGVVFAQKGPPLTAFPNGGAVPAAGLVEGVCQF
jgi:hypothetical protein